MFTLIIADLEFDIYYSELDECWKHWSNGDGVINCSYSMGEVLNKIDDEIKFWAKEFADSGYSQLEVYRGFSQWPIFNPADWEGF